MAPTYMWPHIGPVALKNGTTKQPHGEDRLKQGCTHTLDKSKRQALTLANDPQQQLMLPAPRNPGQAQTAGLQDNKPLPFPQTPCAALQQ